MGHTAVIADDHTFMRKAIADMLGEMRGIHVLATSAKWLGSDCRITAAQA